MHSFMASGTKTATIAVKCNLGLLQLVCHIQHPQQPEALTKYQCCLLIHKHPHKEGRLSGTSQMFKTPQTQVTLLLRNRVHKQRNQNIPLVWSSDSPRPQRQQVETEELFCKLFKATIIATKIRVMQRVQSDSLVTKASLG